MANDDKSRPNLDGPPPAAPGATRRVPDMGMAPAMGMMGGMNPSSATAMPQQIIELAMQAEQALNQLARIQPALMPAVAQIIDTLRTSVAAQVTGGQQPPLMGAGPATGMMGPAPAPAGPGVGAPPMM